MGKKSRRSSNVSKSSLKSNSSTASKPSSVVQIRAEDSKKISSPDADSNSAKSVNKTDANQGSHQVEKDYPEQILIGETLAAEVSNDKLSNKDCGEDVVDNLSRPASKNVDGLSIKNIKNDHYMINDESMPGVNEDARMSGVGYDDGNSSLKDIMSDVVSKSVDGIIGVNLETEPCNTMIEQDQNSEKYMFKLRSDEDGDSTGHNKTNAEIDSGSALESEIRNSTHQEKWKNINDEIEKKINMKGTNLQNDEIKSDPLEKVDTDSSRGKRNLCNSSSTTKLDEFNGNKTTVRDQVYNQMATSMSNLASNQFVIPSEIQNTNQFSLLIGSVDGDLNTDESPVDGERAAVRRSRCRCNLQ